MSSKNIYIIYGVSGSGKTTIGKTLAEKFAIPFFDADDFHPTSNIEKMSQGLPLNDHDREPWLAVISEHIQKWHNDKGAVLACSALKIKYRKQLESIDPTYIKWIFLDGSHELIFNRMASRAQHFFKKELLTSQFETLEKWDKGLSISIAQEINEIVNEIQSKLNMEKSTIGVFGLGVMGKSIAKNLISKNFEISVFNRHVEGKEVDIAKDFAKEVVSLSATNAFDNIELFVQSIQQPRVIILMVNAGNAVDMSIDSLIPYLDKGDCIIDCGNSHYKQTIKREERLSQKGISFIGAGVSGGEEGALYGPSIMPGGTKESYVIAQKFLEAHLSKR